MKHNPISLKVMCGQYTESPNYFFLSRRDYRYNSVDIKIPHNVGLAPIPYIGVINLPSGTGALPPPILRVQSTVLETTWYGTKTRT